MLEDLKKKIDNLHQEFLSIGDNTVDDLKDQEWIGSNVILSFLSVCLERKLKINNFPPSNYEELVEEDIINYEDWEYYVIRCIVENEDLQDMYWYFYNLFYPDYYEKKEELIEFEDIMSGINPVSEKDLFKL